MHSSSSHGPTGMLAHYSVELWSAAPLDLTDPEGAGGDLRSALEGMPGRELVTDGAVLRLVDREAPADGAPPPEWTLEASSMASLDGAGREQAREALEQSWWFADAAEVAGSCAHRLVVTDHLHTGLDYHRRLADLQRLLATVIGAVPVDALWWRPTQQFLEPVAVATSFREDDFANPLPGGLNVRLYDVPADIDGGGFRLMDTLGLGALGLVDLEIRFRGLDPEDVSRALYNAAVYLFREGPVLRDGETIQGPGPNDRWLCRRETSLGEPPREVFLLDPGHPFHVEVPSGDGSEGSSDPA